MPEHRVLGAQPDTGRMEQLYAALTSWATLQSIITTLTETEAQLLMHRERASSNRPRVVFRLYSRYCLKRKERELQELGENKWPF